MSLPPVDYERYWQTRIREGAVRIRPRHLLVLRTLTQLKRSGKVLDIGCGEGHVLRGLGSDYQKFGNDVSSAALELCQDLDATLSSEDLNTTFPFAGEAFDAIIATEVLEHIDNYPFVLREIRKHLRGDGVAIFTIPNTGSLEVGWKRNNGESRIFDESHVNFWLPAEFAAILRKVGFRVRRILPSSFELGLRPLYLHVSLLSTNPAIRLLYDALTTVPLLGRTFGDQMLFLCEKSPTS